MCVCVYRSTDGGENGRAGGGGKSQAALRRPGLEWLGPSTISFALSLGLRKNSWATSEGIEWALAAGIFKTSAAVTV